MSDQPEWVFGYGSLAGETAAVLIDGVAWEPIWTTLAGHRREWTVAADNLGTENDHKFYVTDTGERARCFPTFLNLAPAAGVSCSGLAIPVDGAGLAGLDRREINYERIEIDAALLDPRPPGTVWTYIGLDRATARFHAGLKDGRTVIATSYRECVERAFAAAGDGRLDEYRESTVPPLPPERNPRLRHR